MTFADSDFLERQVEAINCNVLRNIYDSLRTRCGLPSYFYTLLRSKTAVFVHSTKGKVAS
ncbi:MAG: hypothetical protein JPMHGGIA_01215 [Saprospiraceae bacterium]|jgi:hypothetical protein|nr:hypothetical protein [Saprospiraceae bacterium]